VKIMESTSVRFIRAGQRIEVRLQGGAVTVDTSTSPTVEVITPKHLFEAAQLGDCRYLVRLSPQLATTAAAMKGNILVRPSNKAGSYILREGLYAAIDADAEDLPPRDGTTAQKTQPPAGTGKHAGWHIGSLSEGQSIALALGIAGGAAAGIAIPLTQSGTASPSAP
jgi:hypothetical protein